MSATHERSHVISKNDIFLQFSLTSLFQHFVHCRASLCIHHKDFHVRCLETFRSGAHRGERRKITQKESPAFLDFTDKKTKKWKWYFYCKSWHLFARSLSPALSLSLSLCIKSLIAVSYINKAFIFWHLNASLLSCCKVTQVKPFAWISLKGKSNGLPYNAILHIKSYIYKMLFRFSPFV